MQWLKELTALIECRLASHDKIKCYTTVTMSKIMKTNNARNNGKEKNIPS